MQSYPLAVEQQMQRFYQSLNERDRRRYAAIEALKLGHGGIEYIAGTLACDQKTIAKGMRELSAEEEWDMSRQRKKGAGVKRKRQIHRC